jgi:YggT family protein
MNPLQNAGLFLINMFFDFALLLFMIRFLLCWVRADYFNPITRFIINCTQKIISPLRRILPTRWNIEFASLLVIILLITLKYTLLGLIAAGGIKNPLGLLFLTAGEIIKLICNTFFYAIFLFAILSLVQQGFSPLARVLQQLVTPILRPFQRLIPPVSGFDLSPLPALILLQLSVILFANPLLGLGTGIAFG